MNFEGLGERMATERAEKAARRAAAPVLEDGTPANAAGLRCPPGWEVIRRCWGEDWFLDLCDWLHDARENEDVLPEAGLELEALRLCPLADVRVVVLGQDPYPHDAACGLSFSVRRGQPIPVSAQRILDELEADGFGPRPDHFDLRPWARRGVLLLNGTLTVRRGAPQSHYHRGWETLTARIMRAVQQRDDERHQKWHSHGHLDRLVAIGEGRPPPEGPPAPAVYLALGSWARGMLTGIGEVLVPSGQLVCAAHPAARPPHDRFAGSRVFSRVNAHLADLGGAPVDWRLPSAREEALAATRELYAVLKRAHDAYADVMEEVRPLVPGSVDDDAWEAMKRTWEAVNRTGRVVTAGGRLLRGPDPA